MPPSPPVLREARPRTLLLTWSKRACDNDFTLQMQDRETGYGYLPVYTGTDTSWLCESLQRHKEYAFRVKKYTMFFIHLVIINMRFINIPKYK